MADNSPISRRHALRIAMGAGVASSLVTVEKLAALTPDWLLQPAGTLHSRAIPSSNERLPEVGIGTSTHYDVTAAADKDALLQLLTRFPALGGRVIETSPEYGAAESVIGELLARAQLRSKIFLATNITVANGDVQAATRQAAESFRRLQTDQIDLLQLSNVASAERLLPLLRDMKAAKKIRYLGVSTTGEANYPLLEQLMKREGLDFIQVDYAVDNRKAAERVLPLATEKGIAVLVNLPFSGSSVFTRVLGKPVPLWARDIGANSWAQIFLKYVISNPAVTCVIPGTAKIEFLADNLAAGRGKLPDAAMRRRIEASIEKRV